MTDPTTQLRTTLKQHNYSLTTARQVVFDALLGHEPQTIHQVVVACEGSIDRASVYRSVALFEKLGIIRRLQVGWKYRIELSDAFQAHHHHMYCQECGITVELPEDEALEKRLTLLAGLQDFVPQDHQIEIRGLCETCRTDLGFKSLKDEILQ